MLLIIWRKLQKEVGKLKEQSEDFEKNIIYLKIQFEEAKNIEEILSKELEERSKIRERLEAKTISLRKESWIKNAQHNFMSIPKILEEIIGHQRSHDEKTRLRYKPNFFKGSKYSCFDWDLYFSLCACVGFLSHLADLSNSQNDLPIWSHRSSELASRNYAIHEGK